MFAIEYVKSVPRFLTARFLGRRWNRIYTSGLGPLRAADIAPPKLPGPKWSRVRPILSGICGSDLATLTAEGSTYFSEFTSCPFVFGHEVVAEVIEAGPEVRHVRAGDRVVLEPPLHCRVRGIEELCVECVRGRTSHCLNILKGDISGGVQTGFCRDTGGGWSSNFVAHEVQLHPLPEDLPDDEAVLIEPFSCSLHAALMAPLRDDQTALVMGCGTIGALTVAALRAIGSKCRLIVVAKYPKQVETAKRFGADVVLKAGKGLYPELCGLIGAEIHRPDLSREVLLGGGVDVCFDCIGSWLSIDDSLRFTRNRGTVVLVGMPGVPSGVDWTSMWYKEVKITGSYTCDTETFRRAIEIISANRGLLEGFVNAKLPLADYREAIRLAMNAGREGVMKAAFAA